MTSNYGFLKASILVFLAVLFSTKAAKLSKHQTNVLRLKTLIKLSGRIRIIFKRVAPWIHEDQLIEGDNNILGLEQHSNRSQISKMTSSRTPSNGSFRQLPVNPSILQPASCNPNPCQNGGQCEVWNGAVKCRCAGVWDWEGYDEHCNLKPRYVPCQPNPCQNGGICEVCSMRNFFLSCLSKYIATLL